MSDFVLFSLIDEIRFLFKFICGDVEALESNWGCHTSFEVLWHVSNYDVIMRSLRTCNGWLDAFETKFHNVSSINWIRLRPVVNSEKTLSFKIVSNHLNSILIGTNESHILQGLLIDWEEAHGCAVFWRHIGDGSTIGQTKVLTSRSKEFDEFSDNTSLSQHGDAGQDQIGSSRLRRQATRKFETNNLWKHH